MKYKMLVLLKIGLIIFFASFTLAREGFGPGDQEWGYVTVRPQAHMFWWLYYTTDQINMNYEDKPLIIWIQGGPGVSGTGFGNFREIGPLDDHLKYRNYTWVKDYNVLFIDNPVGTGFSYVESNEALATNNRQIANDLKTCIKEFFKQFPKFSQTPTYILAESYGGKMTVEFAYLWYQEQTNGNIASNLKGIGLIDSLISASDMYKTIAPYLYYLGAIDKNGYETINYEAKRFANIEAKADWNNLYASAMKMEYLMQSQTHGVDRLNIMSKMNPLNQHELGQIRTVQGDQTRETEIYTEQLFKVMRMIKNSLKLTSTWGRQEGLVRKALRQDTYKPVIRYVEKLLNDTNIKVFVFNGQLDVIINTAGVLSWIEKLHWQHSDEWSKSPRLPLIVNNIIEGYSKGYENFKMYWVLRSGHMIPNDNPVAMEPILRDLIYH